MDKEREIVVIGHRNPDTDSICSALAYAELKRRITGKRYVAKRAGRVNEETRFVLNYFGVEAPAFVDTLEPRVRDVTMRKTDGIDKEASLYSAWQLMEANALPTLPVLEDGRLIGLITQGDLARSSMDHDAANALAHSGTRCRNIVATLAGELIVGDMERVFSEGSVIIGAADEQTLSHFVQDHSLVIMGNRSGAMLSAIESGAEWLVVCLTEGESVSKLIQTLAEENNCTVIVTPYDTFTAARLINQSMPVRQVMRESNLVTFNENDFISDIRAVMTKKRLRYFPVLDNNEQFVGLISQRNMLDMEHQKVILVDHNEKSQAVEGIDAAEIVEVIDHHRISAIQTMNPVYFRNMPLGCTATIVTLMYQEEGIELTKPIAGILCSAILSDTLCFRSPTCTPIDKSIAGMLAGIAGIDPEEYSIQMFRAGSQLGSKTEEEIFYGDFKTFNAGKQKLGISQVSVVGREDMEALQARMLPYMEHVMTTTHLDMVFLMLTDIMIESTELLFLGNGAKEIVETAFNVGTADNRAELPGVLSRKKQTMPSILMAIQKRTEEGLA